MAGSSVVERIGSRILVRSTRYHLCDDDIHCRLTIDERGAKTTPASGSVNSSSAAAGSHTGEIRYFSLPKHIMEELWLNELPGILEGNESRSEGPAVGTGGAQHAFARLHFLLQSLETNLLEPIETIFQVAAVTRHDGDADLCALALGAASRDTGETFNWCAWINLDDRTQYAQLDGARQRQTGSEGDDNDRLSPDESWMAKLEIRPGEGIIWDRRELFVTDQATLETNQTIRLLIAGS